MEVKSLPPSASSALVIMQRRRYDQGMTDRLSAYTYIPAKQNGRDFKKPHVYKIKILTKRPHSKMKMRILLTQSILIVAFIGRGCLRVFCTPQLDRRLYRWILSHVQRKS